MVIFTHTQSFSCFISCSSGSDSVGRSRWFCHMKIYSLNAASSVGQALFGILGLKVVHLLQEFAKNKLSIFPFFITSTFVPEIGLWFFFFDQKKKNEKLKTCNIISQKEGTCHTSSREALHRSESRKGRSGRGDAEFSEGPSLSWSRIFSQFVSVLQLAFMCRLHSDSWS